MSQLERRLAVPLDHQGRKLLVKGSWQTLSTTDERYQQTARAEKEEPMGPAERLPERGIVSRGRDNLLQSVRGAS